MGLELSNSKLNSCNEVTTFALAAAARQQPDFTTDRSEDQRHRNVLTDWRWFQADIGI